MPLMLDAALRGVISIGTGGALDLIASGRHLRVRIPGKGWLGPGADADFILFDPSGTTLIEGALAPSANASEAFMRAADCAGASPPFICGGSR